MQILSDPEQPQDNSANNSGVIEGLLVDPAFSILLIRVVLPILSSLFCPTLLGFFCYSCASSDSNFGRRTESSGTVSLGRWPSWGDETISVKECVFTCLHVSLYMGFLFSLPLKISGCTISGLA